MSRFGTAGNHLLRRMLAGIGRLPKPAEERTDMARQAARILGAICALFLLFTGPAALAVPIEVSFYADDGSAYGEFAFEQRPTDQTASPLTSGHLRIGDRTFDASELFYEYYPIADSLSVRIRGDETSGLDAGDFINLSFGNPDGSSLELPTRGNLSYNFDGVFASKTGTVTAVPEPLSAGLFGLGAAALAWRRRRRGGGTEQERLAA
jgi:hypothetical protein